MNGHKQEKERKQSRDVPPVHQQDKIFRLSNIYLIGHMSHASLHDMISLSLHGKERVRRKEQRLSKKQKAHDPWDSMWQNPASHGHDMKTIKVS